MLVDLVLGERGVWIPDIPDLVTEAQKVGDTTSDDRNGYAAMC